jgi:hypothetical protein
VGAVAVSGVLAIAGGSASAETSGPVLSSHGIGSVRLGTVETRAIEERELAARGTDRRQSRDGLIFYVSFSTPQPSVPSSRIDEVKVGTCGDS